MQEIKTQDIEFLAPAMGISAEDFQQGNLVDISHITSKYGNTRRTFVTLGAMSYLQNECELSAMEAREGMGYLCVKTLGEVAEYAAANQNRIDKTTFFYQTNWDETKPQWAVVTFCWDEMVGEIVIVFGFLADMQSLGLVPNRPEAH